MGRVLAWAQHTAIALGAPGLFLVAFLDSSFLSLPEVVDLLVIWMVTKHKAFALVYVASATLGSLVGCLIMYYLGRKGGDALVRKRFGGPSVERTLAAFQRYGVMAVLIPSILPPPAPFKIFVVLAGVAGISATRFSVAILVGRGARYLAEGLLALEYGDQAIEFVHANARTVSLALVGILVAALVAYLVWAKRQRAIGR
jgi:membrane protein YqaA with SNARE-associated domain